MKWPGEGDSNPRRCYPHRFSRPAHSTALTSPDKSLEATPGFEPGIRALQAPALATWLCRHLSKPFIFKRWCPGPDLNRHGRNDRGILSPLCLPIPPPGQKFVKAKLLESKFLCFRQIFGQIVVQTCTNLAGYLNVIWR